MLLQVEKFHYELCLFQINFADSFRRISTHGDAGAFFPEKRVFTQIYTAMDQARVAVMYSPCHRNNFQDCHEGLLEVELNHQSERGDQLSGIFNSIVGCSRQLCRIYNYLLSWELSMGILAIKALAFVKRLTTMDPISLTTTCLALLSAVSNGTRFVTDFVINFREARNDIAAVTRELSELDLTLHILKHGAEGNELNHLPGDLRQHIHDIMMNCTTVLADLEVLLRKYRGPGLDRAAKWAFSGRKEAEKIRESLEEHKRALSLGVEATML